MKRRHASLSVDSTHLASKALDLVAPLVLTRTLGFTDRPKPMPHPYGSARIPNAFPSLDRVSIELFPRLNSLRSGWDTEVIPARHARSWPRAARGKFESEQSDRPTLRCAQRSDFLSRKHPTDRPTSIGKSAWPCPHAAGHDHALVIPNA